MTEGEGDAAVNSILHHKCPVVKLVRQQIEGFGGDVPGKSPPTTTATDTGPRASIPSPDARLTPPAEDSLGTGGVATEARPSTSEAPAKPSEEITTGGTSKAAPEDSSGAAPGDSSGAAPGDSSGAAPGGKSEAAAADTTGGATGAAAKGTATGAAAGGASEAAAGGGAGAAAGGGTGGAAGSGGRSGAASGGGGGGGGLWEKRYYILYIALLLTLLWFVFMYGALFGAYTCGGSTPVRGCGPCSGQFKIVPGCVSSRKLQYIY